MSASEKLAKLAVSRRNLERLRAEIGDEKNKEVLVSAPDSGSYLELLKVADRALQSAVDIIETAEFEIQRKAAK